MRPGPPQPGALPRSGSWPRRGSGATHPRHAHHLELPRPDRVALDRSLLRGRSAGLAHVPDRDHPGHAAAAAAARRAVLPARRRLRAVLGAVPDRLQAGAVPPPSCAGTRPAAVARSPWPSCARSGDGLGRTWVMGVMGVLFTVLLVPPVWWLVKRVTITATPGQRVVADVSLPGS